MNRQTLGVLLVLVAAACFGTIAIFGKAAQAAGLGTTTLLSYRFVIGTGLVWAGLVGSGRARLLPPRDRRIALVLGVVYAGFTGLFFWGLEFVPAGVAGLAFFTYPVYVYVIGVAALDESLTGRKLLALALSLGGVGLIVGGDAAGGNLFGVGLVLLAALGYAVYITGNSAALAMIDADLLAGTAMVAATLSFVTFGLVTGRLGTPAGADQWLVVLGIAIIGTAIPIFAYVSGLDRIPASHASVLSTAEPVVTVLLGVALFGERVTVILVVGGILVIGGVVIVRSDLATDTKAPQ